MPAPRHRHRVDTLRLILLAAIVLLGLYLGMATEPDLILPR